jgi:hypothetical protein
MASLEIQPIKNRDGLFFFEQGDRDGLCYMQNEDTC